MKAIIVSGIWAAMMAGSSAHASNEDAQTVALIEWVSENCEGATHPMAIVAAGIAEAATDRATIDTMKKRFDASIIKNLGSTEKGCDKFIPVVAEAGEQATANLKAATK